MSNLVPALLEPPEDVPAWLPEPALADQVVLLVLDGLGWEQLQDRLHLAPTIAAMAGGPVTTVAPSTTSTALTSITTGTPPGQHGIMGYRLSVEGAVLNVLRWTVDGRDVRDRIPPEKIRHVPSFLGHRPAVVTRAEFRSTGFTSVHLDQVRFNGYRMPSTLVVEAIRLARSGEPFVYAYYEGIDKVAHEYGLGEYYDAELVAIDLMVEQLLAGLPSGVTLLITADHGQVDVGKRLVMPHSDVLAQVEFQSGEGRFRWLHARAGREQALLDAAAAHHSDVGWVVSQEQTIDEGWFGPVVTPASRSRLGDVALVAREPVSYVDPSDSGPFELIARHGSLTSAEMLVPLLAASA